LKGLEVSDKPEVDEIEIRVRKILYMDTSPEERSRALDAIEPVIEAAYALGLTQVKPLCLMTADDLVS
jgi:hypothetical protein